MYEAILNKELDKRNFLKKILKKDFLVDLGEKQQGVAHRAAALFSFDPKKYAKLVKDGFVFATATSESIGRTTQIWSIRIEDEAGKLVCISRITMAVISTDRA